MKRLAPGFCVAAILVVASSFGQSPPTAPRSISNSIDVFVTTSTGSPLADADVFITNKPASSSNSSTAAPLVTSNAKTGSDGHAIFRNLPGGAFDVRVERQGYLPVRSDGGTANGFTISVQLGSPTQSTTRQIKVPLIGGGIISGKVEGPSGRPAAGVGVAAMQMRYQNGQRVLSDAGAIFGTAAVRTDDRGEFRIFWLAPGDYYIRVDRPQPRSDRSYVANLFYPGVTSFSSATRVRVREGQEAGGLRIVLAPPSGVKLSGTVTNTIKDTESYQIILTAEGHKSQWIGLSDDPNANDSEFPFEISDVPPGDYELHAIVRLKEPDNRVNYTARAKLTMGSEDLRNIQMTVRKGGDLQVGVSVPPEVRSYLRNLPRSPEKEQLLRIAFQLEVSSEAIPSIQLESNEFENNSMTFSESNVIPGRYRLVRVLPLPPDAYVGDLKQNGQTVYDGVVDVGETPADVQVQIGRNGGTIQGTVTTSPVDAPNYLAVVLVPDAPRRGNFLLYKRQDVGSTPTDPSQFRFSFVGVAPGNYKVIAVDTLPRGSEMAPDVFAGYESRAIAVSVTPGATRDIQVPLIRTR